MVKAEKPLTLKLLFQDIPQTPRTPEVDHINDVNLLWYLYSVVRRYRIISYHTVSYYRIIPYHI